MTTTVTIQNRGPRPVTVLAVPADMHQGQVNQFRILKSGKSVTLPVYAQQQLMVVEGDHSEVFERSSPPVAVQPKGDALPVVSIHDAASDTTAETTVGSSQETVYGAGSYAQDPLTGATHHPEGNQRHTTQETA